MLLSTRRRVFTFTAAIVFTFCFVFFIYSPTLHLNSLSSVLAAIIPPAPPAVPDLIPDKIWYKLGPRGLNKDSRRWTNTCLKKNPTYESEFMTDKSSEIYVKERFEHRPDIVETYLALPYPILKADFLRYLLLFADGGIWSDLDVSCEGTPINDWIPLQYKQNASLVVGWEFDLGWGKTGDFIREFATWTMMAQPASPHLMRVIDDIVKGVQDKSKKYNVTVENMTWKQIGDVIDLTGPRRMTRSVLKSLEAVLGSKIEEDSIGALTEPKLVGDVLIMPGYSFASGLNKYKSGDKQGPALVTHHFAGSWKNDAGGEVADPAA